MNRSSRGRPVPVIDAPVRIQDLAEDGRGVARIAGKVTFVAGALPGELVRIRVVRSRRGIDEAVVSAVEEASNDRVEPGCAHFDVCGGCALQHFAPAAQLAFKQKQVLDAVLRIGGIEPDAVAEPVTGPEWGYRRRARLGARWVYKKNRALVGFRERSAAKIAVLSRCEVLDERVGSRLAALGELIGALSIRDRIPQVEVAAAADAVVLVLRNLAPPTAGDLDALEQYGEREGLVFLLQPGGADSLQPLRRDARLPELRYSPDGSQLELAFEPLDFVQINLAVSQQMVRQAVSWLQLEIGARVLELFCGLGNFSAPLAAAGARVTAVEGEAGLVERARSNAARNGLDAHFVHADLFQPDAHDPWWVGPWDAVLLDPPRAGAQEVLPLVAKTGAARIVYVSCHPGTLARDAAALVDQHGYRLARIGVLDMFPHTAHVESMALFER